MQWSRNWTLGVGAAILAATNAVALLGAAYNRGGTPDSTLRLTERELSVPGDYGIRENSGLALDLRWRVADEVGMPNMYSYGAGAIPGWLDKPKMAELGFDASLPDTPVERGTRFARQLGRDAFVVLELGGDAYEVFRKKAATEAERLKRAGGPDDKRRATDALEAAENGTRLFAIDAGLDAAGLRARYPDVARYAIVRGQVQPVSGHDKIAYRGYLRDLHVEDINVPLELHGVFGEPRGKARFDATVAFGRRFEPWLVSAQRRP